MSRWHAMMKLSEIYKVSLTVDHRRCSPLADCLGELWSLEPGTLTFTRSSASHVFAARFGVVHGDFELDNIAWADNLPTVFDFDECQQSRFADDITQATRDIRHSPADAPLASDRLLDQFIAGYRTVRPIDDHLLAQVPLFAAARAADNLIGLRDIVDDGDTDSDPDWLRRLRISVNGYLDRQRRIVMALDAGK